MSIIQFTLHEFKIELFFRLKYMQAVGLVTGDEFLVPYNLTIDVVDVLDYIKNLTWNWMDRKLFHVINFDDYYGIDFAEIVGSTGFCYNFNMIDADELFHLDM